MSTELATTAAKPPMAATGGAIRPIIPQDFDQAWRIANAVVTAGMAPKDMNTAEKCTIAIMHGMEVGLPPMAALQSIAVVNGRPTIWGDGALALVRASGLCEDIAEWTEGAGDKLVAFCEVIRRGAREPILRTFSADQAKKAGLWNKAGPWTQYPDRMLAMRARAFALRDGFADVMRGLHIKEEVEDYDRSEAPTRQIERPALPARAPDPAPEADRTTTARRGSVEDSKASAPKPVDKPAAEPKPAEKPAMPAEAAAESKPAEKPADVPAEQPAERPVDRPTVTDEPDPDSFASEMENDDPPEDFEMQADQICDALEAAETRAKLEETATLWQDRVAVMPKEFKARCISVLKACRARFAGG